MQKHLHVPFFFSTFAANMAFYNKREAFMNVGGKIIIILSTLAVLVLVVVVYVKFFFVYSQGVNEGVFTYHKCLKAMLNRARDFGKIESNPYDRLRGKFRRGDSENVEYLTEDEMQRFEALDVPEGSLLAMCRDLFIFQMYTGLSFSDTQSFNIKEYRKQNGQWVNNGERIKTGVPYVSVLLPPVLQVLERYGMSVPKINNADYNKHLKALGLMAGIKTRLHSHLARHTFATYMLRNGVKIENVSRMLGHTNITQTQRYAKVLAQSVHEDFEMIEKKLTKK